MPCIPTPRAGRGDRSGWPTHRLSGPMHTVPPPEEPPPPGVPPDLPPIEEPPPPPVEPPVSVPWR
jgi:hypothetical protein